MSEYERGAEAMRGAARRRVQEWILTYSNVEPGAEVRTALSRLRSEIDALALPTPPALDAEPKPDAVAQARERFTEAFNAWRDCPLWQPNVDALIAAREALLTTE